MAGMTGFLPLGADAHARLDERVGPNARAATPDTTAVPACRKNVRRLIVRATDSLITFMRCSSICLSDIVYRCREAYSATVTGAAVFSAQPQVAPPVHWQSQQVQPSPLVQQPTW